MGYQYSTLVVSEKEGQHDFITYELNYPTEKEAFLEYLLPILKEEYGVGINLEEKIKNLKPERARTIKKFMLNNNTPDPNVPAPKNQPWLKNTRSKMAEC
ncbi:MAG: hypothetical protein PHI90_04350, partial [Clostridia bacterium]|nr:hypothetical protein [Clostridia bacterium]